MNDDCVYQAFKRAGYNYPQRQKQSAVAIRRFAEKIGATVHEHTEISTGAIGECIVVAKSDSGSHAMYTESLDSWVKKYGDGEILQMVIEIQ